MKLFIFAAALFIANLSDAAFAMHDTICIGEGACSLATTQSCSVALGKNVQFPPGEAGDHVLVTPEGISPLFYLDGITVEQINGALRAYGRRWRPDWVNPQLDPETIKRWNAECGRPSA